MTAERIWRQLPWQRIRFSCETVSCMSEVYQRLFAWTRQWHLSTVHWQEALASSSSMTGLWAYLPVAYPEFHLGRSINFTGVYQIKLIYLTGCRTCCPVPLRYSAWQFWGHKSLCATLVYAPVTYVGYVIRYDTIRNDKLCFRPPKRWWVASLICLAEPKKQKK